MYLCPLGSDSSTMREPVWPVWPGSSDPQQTSVPYCLRCHTVLYLRLLQRRLGAAAHKSHETHCTVNQSRTPASEGSLRVIKSPVFRKWWTSQGKSGNFVRACKWEPCNPSPSQRFPLADHITFCFECTTLCTCWVWLVSPSLPPSSNSCKATSYPFIC